MPRGNLRRIKPNTHTVRLFAPNRDVADALDPRDRVANAKRDKIAQVDLIERLRRRNEVDHHENGRRTFANGNSHFFNLFREFRRRQRHAILHENERVVEIRARLKRNAEVHAAVVRTARLHVEHPFDAVDLILDKRRDRIGDCARIGTGIRRADADRRRRHVRILRKRERKIRDYADEHNEN